LETDDQGRFVQIVEKPQLADAPSRLANAGIFLLPGSFMQFVARQMNAPHVGEYFMTDVVNDCIMAGQTFAVSSSDAQYLDAGTVEGWVAANQWLLEATRS
jgi:UTP-glucose-1-phosphate uridylyltransferase